MEEILINNEFAGQLDSQVNGQQELEEVSVEELLISCVEARPPLWDSRLPLKDRSRTTRDKLWLEIYEQFGGNEEFSVVFLQKKWRNLRDTFVRIKGEYTPSGSAAKKKKKWEYYDLMTFINDTLSYKQTVTNLQSPSLITPQDTPTSTPLQSPTCKPTVKPQPQKLESAIIDALNKINAAPVEAPPANPGNTNVNQICLRISEMLNAMPQQQRTLLEIRLLQTAYENAKDFLK